MQQTFSKDEIKPCHSCGSKNVHIECMNGNCFAICDDCGTTGANYPAAIQAMRSWNKRCKQKGE